MHKQKVHSGLFDQNDCCPLSAMGFVVPHRIKVARDSGIDEVDESESIFRETSPSRLTNDVAAAPSSMPTVRLTLGTFELGGEHKLNPGLIIAILVFPVTVARSKPLGNPFRIDTVGVNAFLVTSDGLEGQEVPAGRCKAETV